MKLYQAFDVDEVTPAQWLAVHPLRWQEHWGEPAIMFREVDDKTQALADAAHALLAALKALVAVQEAAMAGETGDSFRLRIEAAYEQAAAALALAEGKEAADAIHS